MIRTLGPAGTFSHEACEKIFPGKPVSFEPNFDALFGFLSEHPSDIGIVPIENSLHGSIDEILDLLRESTVRIWSTQDLSIKHAFGAKEPQLVRKIASHSQALRQCRKWLKEKYPQAEHLSVSSTASAAELAAKDPSVGAIASAAVLKKHGLTVISEDIEGDGNTTRFAVVSAEDPMPGKKRTHMMIVIQPKVDRPGLLHDLLVPFKVYDLNMTRIESRPAGTKFGDYVFFIDFQASPDEPKALQTLKDLRSIATVDVLGQW